MTGEPRAFRIPLRRRFRGVDAREGLLLTGPAGWGEFSPFPGYPPEVAARWWAAAREAAEVGWPAPRRTEVPVNVTVPAVGPDDAHALVAASGCGTAKVKVAEPGDGLADDLDRVAAVRDALGPDGRLRVDANGAWDVDTAVAMIGAFARFDLEYVEQPVATAEELAAVRRKVEVPIAADESVRNELVAAGGRGPPNADACRRLVAAADLVVLKVQPLGGVRAALALADVIGLPAVVSSAVETSVGLAAGVALAAALPELPYACGLGTATLLEGDVVAHPLVPVGGAVVVRPVAVDEQALASWELTGPPAARWRQRAAAAAAVAGAPA